MQESAPCIEMSVPQRFEIRKQVGSLAGRKVAEQLLRHERRGQGFEFIDRRREEVGPLAGGIDDGNGLFGAVHDETRHGPAVVRHGGPRSIFGGDRLGGVEQTFEQLPAIEPGPDAVDRGADAAPLSSHRMAAATLHNARLGEEPPAAIGITRGREDRGRVDRGAQPPHPPLGRQEPFEEPSHDYVGPRGRVEHERARGGGQGIVGDRIGERRGLSRRAEEIAEQSCAFRVAIVRPPRRLEEPLGFRRGEIGVGGLRALHLGRDLATDLPPLPRRVAALLGESR